ncbi:MAG: DnaD domain protein [Anaerolineae bacterium]
MDGKKFAGIPAGRMEMTPLPSLLLTELLPEMDDLAEAKVTLHIYHLLYHKKGGPRFVTSTELRSDRVLHHSLTQNNQAFEPELRRGLDKAEARGALLHCQSKGEDWYFFNTAESRKAIAQIERGELFPGQEVRRVLPPIVDPPNIFQLYEEQIGVLTQGIVEELKAAQQEYPPDVILDAFRIANENGARNWKYVRKLLVNWTRGAKHEATGRTDQAKRKPHLQGKFADLVRQQRK